MEIVARTRRVPHTFYLLTEASETKFINVKKGGDRKANRRMNKKSLCGLCAPFVLFVTKIQEHKVHYDAQRTQRLLRDMVF